jgi:hypothetical protein
MRSTTYAANYATPAEGYQAETRGADRTVVIESGGSGRAKR